MTLAGARDDAGGSSTRDDAGGSSTRDDAGRSSTRDEAGGSSTREDATRYSGLRLGSDTLVFPYQIREKCQERLSRGEQWIDREPTCGGGDVGGGAISRWEEELVLSSMNVVGNKFIKIHEQECVYEMARLLEITLHQLGK